MAFIGVTLLSALGGLQSLPDLLDSFGSFQYSLCSLHHLVSDLALRNWSETSPPIQQLERRGANAVMIVVVVGELCER